MSGSESGFLSECRFLSGHDVCNPVSLHWMFPQSLYMHFFLLLMLVLQPISLLHKLRRLQKKQGLIRKVKLILSFLMRIRHQYMMHLI